jgi:uracil-DNA glycosylase
MFGVFCLTAPVNIPAKFPSDWRQLIGHEFSRPYFAILQRFVDTEREQHSVFPGTDDMYRAFELTRVDSLRAVILGQDPYHDEEQAHGLSFSVRRDLKLPPSLRNIYTELHSDLGIRPAEHGCLDAWARQGVLLLNSVLTVRAHEPHSHRDKGWEEFTSRVIQAIDQRPYVAFVLWGKPAQKIAGRIADRHLVIRTPHPSPLSAYRGFFGSRPFSKINACLKQNGQPEIHWDVSAESNAAAPAASNFSATAMPT